jgi:hypothetical protein
VLNLSYVSQFAIDPIGCDEIDLTSHRLASHSAGRECLSAATFGHSCLKKLASGMTGLKAQQTLLVVATAIKNSTKQALEVR